MAQTSPRSSSTMRPPLNILVVGNSIAGPSLASFLLLSNLKVHITLLERAPRVRPEGQNIDLRHVGVDCARRLGLETSIRAHLTGEAGVSLVNSHDRAIASIAASKPGETQGPTADIEMLRGTLAKLLVERCEELGRLSADEGGARRLESIYDDYVEELQQNGDSVTVKFANSKAQRSFDIVVGADGLQSRTRRHVFGVEGEAKRLHKLGIYGAFFSIPRNETDSDWRKWFHAPSARGVMLRPSDRSDRTTVFMHKKTEDPRFTEVAVRQRDVQAQKDLIHETFANVDWSQRDRLLKELDQSEDFYYDMIAQVKMDKWSKGRVVLLGDAAHCTTPLSGMGTSLALAGGYNLAGALSHHPDDVAAAFTEYEEAQRELVAPAQELSPAVGLIFNLNTPTQIWFTNYFTACMAFFAPVMKWVFSIFAPGTGTPQLREYGFRVPAEAL